MARLLVLANEATAAQRRVYFHLVDATDGLTAETGEAAGQPQVSSDGGAWTNTGIGTLNAIGNGRYYADLTQTLVQTAGTLIETRYKSANTAECPGDSVQVVAFDPNDTVRLGLTALPNAAAAAQNGLMTCPVSGNVLPSGAITSSVLATGCIDNTHLAADAIGGDELAATAISKIATGIWTDTTAGDFTVALSIGKSIMNGVSLGTGLTINAYTGNTVQTGDSYGIVNSGTHGNAALKTLIDTVDNFIDTEVSAIKTVTDAIGATGSGLSAIPWNAAWDAEVQSEVADGLTAYGVSTVTTAQVNTEVLDVLNTDTFAEPAQGTPGATITLAQKIGYLYKAWRNRKASTSTTFSLYNDDAATVDHKSTLSDDGTTFGETEKTTGP